MSTSRLHDPDDGNMSMREKSRRKKEIDRIHESNYKAGHIDIRERNLHRTGIRGRKIYVLLVFLLLLLMLCLFNLIVLIVVYSTLHISTSGMKSISFLSNGDLKFLQDSDLKFVLPQDGTVGGYDNEDIVFTGDSQNVTFDGGLTERTASFNVGPHGVVIEVRNALEFIDPSVKNTILHISKDSNLKFGSSLFGPTLKSKEIQLPRVVGDETDLAIDGAIINVTGNEGLYVDAKVVKVVSEQDVKLTVRGANSALRLSGNSGIYLDSVPTSASAAGGGSSWTQRHRLCGCSNNGRLFRVSIQDGVPASCATASSNPCI